jgi:hypothetical protein
MMKLLLFSLFAFTRSVTALIDINRIVDHVNEYRRLHQAPPLVFSPVISEISQSWADHMANNNVFEHSVRSIYGENIAMTSNVGNDAMIQSIDMFYSEVSLYDYKKPVFSSQTGHFTQLVWMNTKEIGLGISTSSNGYTYICTHYYPPGNYANDFIYNVKPKIEFTPPSNVLMKEPPPPSPLLAPPPPSPPLRPLSSPYHFLRSPPFQYPSSPRNYPSPHLPGISYPPPSSYYTLSIKYPSTNTTHVIDVLCPAIENMFGGKCIIQLISSTGIYYGTRIQTNDIILRNMIARDLDNFTKSCKIVCGSTISVRLNVKDLFRYQASTNTCT